MGPSNSKQQQSNENPIKQIEKWTQMKMGNVIFDSDVHDWNKKTSVFDQIVINKSNLIFLIEDEDDNLFGGYVNAKIDKYDWLNDQKSFVFSLKSNGRLKGMMKFDITHSKKSFYLRDQKHYCLFAMGGGFDICFSKKEKKTESFCDQLSFNYNGIQNTLCGKYNFTPTRLTVVQLI